MTQKPTYEELENRINLLSAECNRYKKTEGELNKSLRFTESLLKAIPTPIFFKDAQGRYQGCNSAFSEAMGKSSEELRGKTVHELWPSEQAEVYHQKDLELMQHPTDQVYEFEVKDKDGVIRPVIFYKSVFRDEHGKVAGLVGGFVDITEQKRMGEALKEAHGIIKESPSVAFLWKNEEGWPVEFVTENVAVLFEYTAKDFISSRLSYVDVVHPDDLVRVGEEVTNFSKEEGRDRFTHEPYRIITKEGDVKWVSDSTFIRRDEKGQITHYQGIVEDVTEARDTNEKLKKEIYERQHTEEELRSSERRLSDIIDFLPDATFVIDLGGKVIAWNHAMEELTGIKSDEIVGKGNYEYAIPFYGDRRPVMINLALQWDEKTAEQYEYVRRDGETLVSETRNPPFRKEPSLFWNTARPLHNVNGDIIGAIEVIRDITEHMLADEALKAASQEKEVILSSLMEFVLYEDRDMKIRWANRAACESVDMKPDEIVGRHCYEIWEQRQDPCPDCPVQKAIETGKPQEIEKTTPDGKSWIIRGYPVHDVDNHIIGGIEVVLDITDRVKAETALKEASDIINKSPTVAFLWKNDVGWPVEFVTENIEALLGYTSKELTSGKVPYVDVIHPEDLERVSEEVSRCSKEEGRRRLTHDPYRIITKNGEIKWIKDSTFIRRDEHDQITHYQGIVEDITKARETEDALRESETRFRTLVENSQAGIFLVNEHYRFIYANDELCSILGFSQDELAGLDFRDVLDDESREFVANRYVRRQKGEDVPSRYEVGIVRKDGEKRQLEMVATAIRNPDGSIRTMGQALDITDRKELEVERDRLFNLSLDMLCVAGFDGFFKQINPAWNKTLGWTEEELLSKPWIELVHPDDHQDTISAGEKLVAGKTLQSFENRYLCKDGSYRWISWNSFPLREENLIFAVARDISEQKRMEEALAASERNYREIFDKTDDVMLIHDLDGKILDVNQAFFDMTGMTLEKALNSRIQDFSQGDHPYAQDEATKFIERSFKEGPQRFEWLGRGKNDELVWTEITLKHALIGGQERIIAAVRDISERKRSEQELAKYREGLEELVTERTQELESAQEELLKRERLAVLGQLTATVSHELRNPLGVIRSSSFYLQQKYKGKNEKVKKHMNRIEDQVEICDSIVSDLLEYTRGRHSQMVKGEFNPWLEQILDEIPESDGIKIERVLHDHLPHVHFDKDKIRRVMVNLIDNAIQSIKERKQMENSKNYHPKIEVSSKEKDEGIIIIIKDNGIGMDEVTMKRAFEPLFTTRARGTGLGLANVEKIIQEHNGRVELKSKPHRETTVFFTIPAGVRE